MIASSPEQTSSLVGSLPTEKHRGNTGLTRVVGARVHVGLDFEPRTVRTGGMHQFVVLVEQVRALLGTGGVWDRWNGVQSVIQDDPYSSHLPIFRIFHD